MGRINLNATASPFVRRLNPLIFAGNPPRINATGENAAKRQTASESAKTAKKPRFRRFSDIPACRELNKSETEVASMLSASGLRVVGQALRLPLTGGGIYNPDLLAWEPDADFLRVVEVKGGYRGPGADQGYERYKRAALEWHCAAMRFEMWERVGREWRVTEWDEP